MLIQRIAVVILIMGAVWLAFDTTVQHRACDDVSVILGAVNTYASFVSPPTCR